MGELNLVLHKYFRLPKFPLAWCLLFCGYLLAVNATAAEPVEIEIVVPETNIYTEPSTSSKVVGKLKRGKKLRANGPLKSGYYRLKSRSGRALFVQVVDVREMQFDQTDLFEVPNQGGERRQSSGKQASRRRGPYLSWDLGASSGSVGDVAYTEVNLGLNWFFKDWLAWRNAGFYRFVSVEGVDNIYGLDTMARLYHQLDFSELAGITFFGGPGFRFINEGDNLPFAEGGLILKLAGLSLGGGIRTFFTRFVDKDAENDTQFFIVLSGSGII